MRELPEPDIRPEEARDMGLEELAYFSAASVLAIQRKAYEDGLRDAAKLCKRRWKGGYPGEVVKDCSDAILAMLTASQKEQK